MGGPPPFHPPPRRLRSRTLNSGPPERKITGRRLIRSDTANPMGIRGGKAPSDEGKSAGPAGNTEARARHIGDTEGVHPGGYPLHL